MGVHLPATVKVLPGLPLNLLKSTPFYEFPFIASPTSYLSLGPMENFQKSNSRWKIYISLLFPHYPAPTYTVSLTHLVTSPFLACMHGCTHDFCFSWEVPSLHRNMTVFLHLYIFELPNYKGNQKECFQFWIHSWQSLGIELKTPVCALQLFDIFPWPWKDMLMGSLLLDYYFNFGFIIDCFYFMYSYFRVLL